MKGKLLRGITGSIQPRRLLHGYQGAVFAWSGENPFANLAQSDLYRILPRSEYKDSWIKSTPYGKAFRANYYSGSGHGYVFSSHVPSANITYAAGVTGYAEFVYSGDSLDGQSIQHLCCITSTDDGNTENNYHGVLTLGLEVQSGIGLCPAFRIGNNTVLIGFAGGTSDGGSSTLVSVSIPVGTKVRQIVTFDPVSKEYASIIAFNDVVYEASGTVPNGFASTGSSILVGGYPKSGARAAYVSGMLEAAIWNRGIPPDEMRALIQQPSIFQPTEFIFPFSFGESSGSSEVINTVPKAITLSPAQAAIQTTEILNTSADALSLTPVAANLLETVTVLANPAIIDLTGVNADINISGQIQIPAIPATITLVANSATLVQHAVINTQPDTLTLAPVAAGLYAGEAVVDVVAKALTLSQNQAAIVQHGVLVTTPENIALHGSKAELHITDILATSTAHASLYGAQAGLYSTEILAGKPDSMMLASMRAQITYESPIVWGSTTIEARLQDMTIEARQ